MAGRRAALKRALTMSLEERRERHAPMLAQLLKNDIRKWARTYLSALIEGPSPRGLLGGIRSLFKPAPEQTPSPQR